ncbi:rhomboid family intramembrane serine protease [Piscinibacter sakaiensis]|uniref:rhomboid family intramembrane serine protease n=1 Tax=Piscinibacter sakaiensis TaxID=1547922 RepID=UPI003AAACFC3
MDTLLVSPAAAALLAIILVASLVGLKLRPDLLEAGLFRPYWLLPRREYATLISNAFLHADLGHLLFNGITFWAFAFPLERMIGSGKFLALYFFGLLVSDAATWLRHKHDPAYRCLGASGAILAVLFAAIVYVPGASIFILPIPVPIPAPLFAVLYLAYSVWASRRGRGRINHDAHLAGAAAGIVFVAVVDTERLVGLWQYLVH